MAEFARRHLRRSAGWGRIVNVSTDGASGFRTELSYGASKHALESYSRAAAAELGRYGITVNVVALGPIQTGWITPDLERAIVADTPLRRVGQPQDVADVVVFLASEQARWLTGQLLYVCGGHAMPLQAPTRQLRAARPGHYFTVEAVAEPPKLLLTVMLSGLKTHGRSAE